MSKALAIVGLFALLSEVAGCGSEAELEGSVSEETAETRQDLAFSLWERGRVGPPSFHVRQGGVVSATVSAFRLKPPGCNQIGWAGLILTKRRPAFEEINTHPIFPDGKTKIETWSGLDAGDYDLTLDTHSQNPDCRWVGDVFVVAK
jgi:hypothetical protein